MNICSAKSKSRIAAAAFFASFSLAVSAATPAACCDTSRAHSLACISHWLWLLRLVLQHTDSCACLACCHVPLSLSLVSYKAAWNSYTQSPTRAQQVPSKRVQPHLYVQNQAANRRQQYKGSCRSQLLPYPTHTPKRGTHTAHMQRELVRSRCTLPPTLDTHDPPDSTPASQHSIAHSTA